MSLEQDKHNEVQEYGISLKYLVYLILIIVMWWVGYCTGKREQIEKNIKHKVMDKNGNWKQKFWISKDYIKQVEIINKKEREDEKRNKN